MGNILSLRVTSDMSSKSVAILFTYLPNFEKVAKENQDPNHTEMRIYSLLDGHND